MQFIAETALDSVYYCTLQDSIFTHQVMLW